nr:TRAV11 [Sphenodon punctatus]
MPLVLLIVMLSSLGDPSRAEEVSQDHLTIASEGQPLNLSCSHPSLTTHTVIWYRQFPNQALHAIVSGYYSGAKSNAVEGVLFVSNDRKSNVLSISRVTLKDSAVYFCALRGTVYVQAMQSILWKWNKTICDSPNLQKSEPSVYELESTNKSHPLSACLFTDYFPGNINVSATGSDLVGIESSVVVVEDQASYGAVLWQNANENLQCIANYDGEDIQAKKDIADSCSGTQMSFQTDERLNLLSLTVLGLRVIFFKSVAVNLLLTFRLWSR